jgi:predicted MPP superfamily phosphohydrolase
MLNKIGRFLKISFLILAPVFVFLGAWAFWYEPSSLTVKNYDLKIQEWQAAHNNFKIVTISDVHGGSNFVDDNKIRQVVEKANEQNADLIVLLGDYVSQQRFDHLQLNMPMQNISDNLRGLQANFGVYAVLGNHDALYSDARVRTELERAGIRVLENEAIKINVNKQDLILLGLPDVLKVNASGWEKYCADARSALAKLNAKGGVIVLTHSPDIFPFVSKTDLVSPDLRLVLAGHTHGGQVRFPFVGSLVVPSSYGQKYALGHVTEDGKNLFVTPGIGTSIFPVRFRVPPEVSVLTISNN